MNIFYELIENFTTSQNLYGFITLPNRIIRERSIYEQPRLLVEKSRFQVLAVILPEP